jgi:polysaccharide export outer membrane protein
MPGNVARIATAACVPNKGNMRPPFAALSVFGIFVLGHAAAAADHYLLQPGDVLAVAVWKEPELTLEVLVRPDGGISLPLTGDIEAAGHTSEEVRATIYDRLHKLIPDATVTVAVKQISGNQIYVIGKVNRPGPFSMNRPTDVMQALSLAGGTTPFAAVNDIHVLRRVGGQQQAIAFHYGDVESGRHLDQNILLQAGDTVVVP